MAGTAGFRTEHDSVGEVLAVRAARRRARSVRRGAERAAEALSDVGELPQPRRGP